MHEAHVDDVASVLERRDFVTEDVLDIVASRGVQNFDEFSSQYFDVPIGHAGGQRLGIDLDAAAAATDEAETFDSSSGVHNGVEKPHPFNDLDCGAKQIDSVTAVTSSQVITAFDHGGPEAEA
jgi:hypothetical protein